MAKGDFEWGEWAKLVSEKEAETVDYVVCLRDVAGEPRMPLAKHFGNCQRCLHAIYWADSAPKRPPKICVECALELTEEEGNKKKKKP